MSRCFSLCEYDDESGEWVGLNCAHREVRFMALEQQPEYVALKRDAERYRWLRDQCTPKQATAFVEHTKAINMDATIDAAMAQTHNGEVSGG